jgi:hypothetical protein
MIQLSSGPQALRAIRVVDGPFWGSTCQFGRIARAIGFLHSEGVRLDRSALHRPASEIKA